MSKITSLITLLFINLLLINSCRQVHVFEGRSVIINQTTDMSLNDSISIFGRVYSAEDNKTPETESKIWLEESARETISDTSGFYSLKSPAGVYTLKCKGRYSNDNETEVLKNISLLPNEKIEINFYLGITVE